MFIFKFCMHYRKFIHTNGRFWKELVEGLLLGCNECVSSMDFVLILLRHSIAHIRRTERFCLLSITPLLPLCGFECKRLQQKHGEPQKEIVDNICMDALIKKDEQKSLIHNIFMNEKMIIPSSSFLLHYLCAFHPEIWKSLCRRNRILDNGM